VQFRDKYPSYSAIATQVEAARVEPALRAALLIADAIDSLQRAAKEFMRTADAPVRVERRAPRSAAAPQMLSRF
jgi:hypothetical protein